jgi:hypothetical protein
VLPATAAGLSDDRHVDRVVVVSATRLEKLGHTAEHLTDAELSSDVGDRGFRPPAHPSSAHAELTREVVVEATAVVVERGLDVEPETRLHRLRGAAEREPSLVADAPREHVLDGARAEPATAEREETVGDLHIDRRHRFGAPLCLGIVAGESAAGGSSAANHAAEAITTGE